MTIDPGVRKDEVNEAITRRLAEEMEAETRAARERALDWIQVIHDIDEQFKPLEKARNQAREALKQYLALNADTLDKDEKDQPMLWHPDLGETYALQGSTSYGYDLVSAAEAEPEAVVNAAKAGWLKADHASVEKHPGAGWVDRLKRYAMPTAGSTSLVKKR